MKLKLFITLNFILVIFLNTLSAQTITFKKKKPAVNTEKFYSFNMNMKLDITAYQNEVPITNFTRLSNKIENKRIKILNIVNDKIKKIELSYDISEETDKEDDIESKRIEIVSGKSYFIEENNNELKITNKDGSFPQNDEIQFITNNNNNKLNEDIYLENQTLTITIGDRAPALEAVLKNDFLSSLNIDKNATEVFALFKELKMRNDSECAVFDIKINTKAQIETLQMEMNLTGDFLLDTATSIPVLLKISGPIYMLGKTETEGQVVTMKGIGILDADLSVKNIK